MTSEAVLVEVCGVQGRVLARERVVLNDGRRAFTVGRGANADVTLDDDYAAPIHASVEVTPEGRILVSDLGSRNGVVVAGKRHQGVSGLEVPDGMLKVGHTRLRIRTGRESLAPEKPDQIEPTSVLRNPTYIAAVAAVICVVQFAYEKWLSAPRDLAVEIVPDLVIAMLVAAGWISFWAVVSRVTQWVWRWSLHAAILFSAVALVIALDGILQLVAFAMDAPQSNARGAWLAGIALGLVLYLHLTHATSLSLRWAALLACLFPALLVGTSEWKTQREAAINVNYVPDTLRIYPPQLRLRSAGSVEAYFERNANGLRERADRKRVELPAFDGADEAGPPSAKR